MTSSIFRSLDLRLWSEVFLFARSAIIGNFCSLKAPYLPPQKFVDKFFISLFYVLNQKISSFCPNLENIRKLLCLDLKIMNKFFPAFFSNNHYEFFKIFCRLSSIFHDPFQTHRFSTGQTHWRGVTMEKAFLDYFTGRNFRGQKLSRFRVFWPHPRKFMSAKFVNNNYPRKFMSAKIFQKVYPGNFISIYF